MINSEKEKYANGSSMEMNTMSKEEKLQAIEYWCEGNQELRKLLLYFNEKDIETVGCCSGHEESFGPAYIGLKLGNQQENEVIDLLAKLEINSIDATIAFERGEVDRSFVLFCAPTIGNNEKFFGDINECWNRNIQKDHKFHEIRKKYELLKILFTDKRAQEYTDSAEISYKMGDEYVRAVRFYKYDGKILNIPITEIGRMGQWLIENPNTKISKEFYGEETRILTYIIKEIKEKCKISKIPLSMIKNAYESIKNVLLKSKENIKMQEEGTR